MSTGEIMGIAFFLTLVALLCLTTRYCDLRDENDELRLKLLRERALNLRGRR